MFPEIGNAISERFGVVARLATAASEMIGAYAKIKLELTLPRIGRPQRRRSGAKPRTRLIAPKYRTTQFEVDP